jgi:hypothetical protein
VRSAEEREALEAVIRREATYRDRRTGRYACAISEEALQEILVRVDLHATVFASECLDQMTRARRQADRRATLADAIGVQP